MRVIDRPDMRALSPQGEIDRLNALVELKEARIAFLEGEVARLQKPKLYNGFFAWWQDEGNDIRFTSGESFREWRKRFARIAWHNGAFTALHQPYVPTCLDCDGYELGPYPRCLLGKTATRVCKAFERRRK